MSGGLTGGSESCPVRGLNWQSTASELAASSGNENANEKERWKERKC